MVDSIERLREVRDRLVDVGAVVGPASRSRKLFPVAIGMEEGAALRGWVRKEGARRTLEAGLGFAISTLFIVEGLLENGSDVRHVAADPYQLKSLPTHRTTYAGVGLHILEQAGVRGLVEFYAEESQIVLPRLLAEGRQLDLVFLDGNHRFEAVFLDLFYSGRLLRDGGTVFVDDTRRSPARRCGVDHDLAGPCPCVHGYHRARRGSAPPERAGVASGFSETGAELGGALGIAILGSVGVVIYRNEIVNLLPEGLPAGAAKAAQDTLGAAIGKAATLPESLATELVNAARTAFVHGMQLTTALAAGVAIVISALAVGMLRHVRSSSAEGVVADSGVEPVLEEALTDRLPDV